MFEKNLLTIIGFLFNIINANWLLINSYYFINARLPEPNFSEGKADNRIVLSAVGESLEND